jgi:hypothetical protein
MQVIAQLESEKERVEKILVNGQVAERKNNINLAIQDIHKLQ